MKFVAGCPDGNTYIVIDADNGLIVEETGYELPLIYSWRVTNNILLIWRVEHPELNTINAKTLRYHTQRL